MRENRMDVVLLDQEFDPTEQGAAFVTREVTVLRPAQRRRLFFVLLSPVLRTMEAHAAFLNNVNAIVNHKGHRRRAASFGARIARLQRTLQGV